MIQFDDWSPQKCRLNVTDVGGLTIYQQPGESADALANRVIGKLEDRARRSGRKC